MRSRQTPSGMRWALAALISCMSLLVVVPAASAAGTGSISGRVTSDVAGPEFGFEVVHLEVTAYQAEAPNTVVESAETSTSGEYKLASLARGKYIVGFRSSLSHQLDFAPQFYPEKPRFAEADEVDVIAEGEARVNIDAKLREGASVSGTVTDADTHQPLGGAIVEVIPASGSDELAVLTETTSNGNYTAIGLPSGSFYVAFVFERETGEGTSIEPYSLQIYNDVGVPEEEDSTILGDLALFGDAVTVTAPNTTAGIDAALVLKAPVDTGAPSVSGTPAVGQTLSCATGSWTGIATLTYAYKWLRGGVPIAGATASSYVIQASDAGDSVGCEVTATNKSGSASAVSNTLAVPVVLAAVPAPAVIVPVPVIVLSAADITVSGSSAAVPIACKEAGCSGSIELTEQVVVRGHEGKRTTSKKETVILAKGSYSLAAGRSATVAIRLTAAGKSALAKASHHRLSAETVVSVSGGKTVQRPITLSEPAAAKHAAKHS